ncbi:MAG: type IV toxin-antitoxin system AbiEi family antitoxin domain-containing protein [Acidobacteriota bacterium]
MKTILNKDRIAKKIFQAHGGLLRTSQAIKRGIHPSKLYQLRDKGIINEISRGIYQLSEAELTNPELITVVSKIPQAVVCLISALAFHDLTTVIPNAVYIALPNKAWRPTLSRPSIKIFWFSGAALTEGIDIHLIDGVKVNIYNPAKTVADCFKYRNKIGLSVALEALKEYRKRKGKGYQIKDLLYYARICRVERIIIPYLEAIG